YVAYRATVRGVVEGIKLQEKEISPHDRMATLAKAKGHWLLALSELEAPSHKPCLVLISGLPGVGKSSVAAGLASKANFTVIRSDVVRKELAGLKVDQPSPQTVRSDLYSKERNRATYADCLARAERLLFEGKRVIVDATFREETQRGIFLEAAV